MHKPLVPLTRINETWKADAATLIGYLMHMSEKYQTITILAQGASIASLLALLVSKLEADLPQVRLCFLDLGRVQAVTTPETLHKQACAIKLGDYFTEGKEVLRNTPHANFILVTQI